MATSAPPQIHTRLRVFLAVARHLSFTRAGEELSITTGAVSQQIKLLEDWLAQRLFRRLPRRLELTDAGKRLLAAVDPAYAAVELAIGRLRGGALSGVVRVRTLPSFLATWLVPRLPRLMRALSADRAPGRWPRTARIRCATASSTSRSTSTTAPTPASRARCCWRRRSSGVLATPARRPSALLGAEDLATTRCCTT